MGMSSRRQRQAGELMAVMAAFAFVAYAVINTGGSAQQTVLVSKSNQEFRGMWKGWLHKLVNQVDAAVDLSKGLPKQKEEKLNNLLENDVKHDISQEKKMVDGFDGDSDSSRVKKAVRSVINRPASTSSKAASKAVRAAVKAVKGITKQKDAKVTFENKAEREEPVSRASRNVISPFSKHVQNAVYRDDQKVAKEEAMVKAEERQLMGEEGVHQTKQARARHAIHAATKSLQMSSKPLKQAQKATKPATAAAAAHAARRERSESISALKARDDKMENEASIPAQGASAEMAKVMGKSKDLKMMQGALAAVLQKTDKDPEAAKEAKEEEKSWGGMLKNWGIGR